MVTPAVRREALEILKAKGLSERAACRIVGVSRRIASYALRQPVKDKELGTQLIEASGRYPRFGYRRIAVMTDQSIGRVWRLWRSLGLNLPKRRPRKRRCGSDIRIPGAMQPNSVWSYDFVHDRLANGGMIKMLCVLDEHTRECLAIEVGKSLRNQDVILTLSRLMRLYGKPAFIRSDNVLNARGFAEKGKSIPAKRKSPFGSSKRASTTIQCSSTSRISLPDHSGHKIRSVLRHDLHRT